jgi:membrane associated rhomboid family serine protease
MSRSSLFGSAIVPFRLVFLMWLAFALEFLYGWPLSYFGIIPRTLPGIVGILVSPMLHGSFLHLVSNTIPLLFLGSVLFFFYERFAVTVFFRAYFWTNLLVWLFGRPASVHIGASGVVYALAFFLIFFGIFYRDFRSLIITIVVLLTYGGIFYGVLPGDPSISWESHLAGALVGISTAITLASKKGRV